jgi:serine/threonine protein kinase
VSSVSLHQIVLIRGSQSNILVDIKEGKYKACLTDFGLSTVLGGLLGDCAIEGSTVRYGAVRWTAPELLQLALNHSPGAKPTKQNDIYSFGRVMFHVSVPSP